MRALVWLSLVLVLDLATISALTAPPPELRGTIILDPSPIRRIL